MFHRVKLGRFQAAVCRLQCHVIRKRFLERACSSLPQIWLKIHNRMFLREPLVTWFRLSCSESKMASKTSAFATSVQMFVRYKYQNVKAFGFNGLRRAALIGSLENDQKRFYTSLERVIERGKASKILLFAETFGFWFERSINRRRFFAISQLQAYVAYTDALR